MPDPTERPPARPALTAIETAVLQLTEARGPTSSICPSEVARALAPEWRPLLSAVRRAAVRLAAEGRIDILRKGKRVPPDAARGVIRLRATAGSSGA